MLPPGRSARPNAAAREACAPKMTDAEFRAGACVGSGAIAAAREA